VSERERDEEGDVCEHTYMNIHIYALNEVSEIYKTHINYTYSAL
jgi:hypothetical protein